MKRLLLPIFIFVAVAAFLMGTVLDVNAAFVLTLDDTATSGVDIIVVDDGGVGTSTAVGLSTVADAYSGEGVVFFNGAVGAFTVSITTGISKPVVGPPNGPEKMDLNSVHVTCTSGGTLVIMLTDTDFNGPVAAIENAWGGVTNGTVTAQGYLDPENIEFAMPSEFTTGPQGPFGPGSYSDTAFKQFSKPISGPFSLTEVVTINHTGAGQLTSFDKELSTIPVPDASVAFLLGSAFLLGFAVSRKREKE